MENKQDLSIISSEFDLHWIPYTLYACVKTKLFLETVNQALYDNVRKNSCAY